MIGPRQIVVALALCSLVIPPTFFRICQCGRASTHETPCGCCSKLVIEACCCKPSANAPLHCNDSLNDCCLLGCKCYRKFENSLFATEKLKRSATFAALLLSEKAWGLPSTIEIARCGKPPNLSISHNQRQSILCVWLN